MPNPTCPTNCTTALPAVKFDSCQPKITASELKRVFIGIGSAASFTDALAATEWGTRLDEATTGVDKLRPLIVTGSMAAGSPKEAAVSNRRTYVTTTDRTLNFTVDDVSTENYAFMRTLECGGTFKIWWETWGGQLYGGNDGVKVTITPNIILGGADTDIEKIEFVAKWKSKFSPERGTSPIFTN